MAFDTAQPLTRHADQDGAPKVVNDAFVVGGRGEPGIGAKGDARAVALHTVRCKQEGLRQNAKNLSNARFIRAAVGVGRSESRWIRGQSGEAAIFGSDTIG